LVSIVSTSLYITGDHFLYRRLPEETTLGKTKKEEIIREELS
jgi:hypothetical protein